MEEMNHMWAAVHETDMHQLAGNVSGPAGRAHVLAGTATPCTSARHISAPGRQARALWLLGTVHRARGVDAAAESLGRQALELASDLGMRPLVAHCHAAPAIVYGRSDTRAAAEEHAATALYDEMQLPYWRRAMEITPPA